MKIFCVSHNYQQHPTLKEPAISTIPDSAMILRGRPFFVPDFAEQFDVEASLVVKINRLGKDIAVRFAHRYYSEITVGVHFCARDLFNELQKSNFATDIATGFDASVTIGDLIDKKDTEKPFCLTINGTKMQNGKAADMIHSIDELIAYISKYHTLKMGDLIFTGCPGEPCRVQESQQLSAFIGDRQVLDLKIK